jgi:hypothetical protein
MKYILALSLSLSLALTGCYTANYEENTGKYKMPKELEDCKIYTLQGEGIAPAIKVVRCPTETTTSYKHGKATKSVTIN